MERGAKRNTDPWKRGLEETIDETDEQRLDRIEREMGEADGQEERNAMAELEAKTEDAKREMAVADALDEIRSRNARLEKAQRDGVEVEVVVPEDELRRKREEEDAAEASRLFALAKARAAAQLEEIVIEQDDSPGPSGGLALLGSDGDPGTSAGGMSSTVRPTASATPSTADSKQATTDMPPPSFKRQVKKKKDHSALLGIKKKQT